MNARRQLTQRIADAPFVRRHKPDYQIILYMGLLMLLGLIIMYAIGPQRANVLNNSYGTDYYSSTYFFVKQTISLFLALVAFVIVASLPFRIFLKHAGKLSLRVLLRAHCWYFLVTCFMLMRLRSVVLVLVVGLVLARLVVYNRQSF